MKRAVVILNENAGKGAAREYKDAIIEKLNSAFSEVDVRVTKKDGDAEEWGRQAREGEVDSVFAVGGDGTVSEVVRGMLKDARQSTVVPSLGIFPGGTGNGFVRTLGMPATIEETLHQIDLECTKAIDIGYVNGIPFTYTVTLGSLPEGIREVPSEEKSKLGFFAYILSEVNKIGENESYTFEISIDGDKKTIQANSMIIFSANALAEQAMVDKTIALDDGWLHVLVLKDAALPSLLSVIPSLLMQTLEQTEAVEYFKAHEIHIESPDEQMDCGIDGDDGVDLPLDLSIEPRRLQVYACR